MTMKKNMRGGTLLGFIIGLLVGLGGALVVAIYVTKAPVPFVDRDISRQATQDAIEAERNRNWDPNAAITGKPQTPAAATDPDAPAVSAPGAATPAASGDPLGDLAQTRAQQAGTTPQTPATPAAPAQPATPAAAATPGADAFDYFVQAGAFRTQTDADSQKARLAMLGFNARVTERAQGEQTIFRVRVGPLASKAEAESMQAKLMASGQDAALVRVQK